LLTFLFQQFSSMNRLWCLVLLILLFEGSTRAQGNLFSDERLREQLHLYSKKNPENILFLHTDKTLYTNNEIIFFSGYLVKSAIDVNQHIILSTALISDNDRAPTLEKKFDIQNGFSSGSISLPDTIVPGNYHLIAYTNVVDGYNIPEAFFTQAITIKSISEPPFTASLQLIDTVPGSNIIRARVNVLLADSRSKIKPVVAYSIGRQRDSKVGLDSRNSGMISVTKYDIQNAGVAPVLLVTVNYNNQRQYLHVNLPSNDIKGLKIRFYPEGGDLINSVESIVALESSTGTDNPISIQGVLYKNDRPLDTISTNSYGFGKFRVRPELNAKYQLLVKANTFLLNDTMINLPAIQPTGVTIQVDHAIVNDTLRVKVFAGESIKVRILIHNYREGFASFDLYAKPAGGIATVAIGMVPKGIAAITIIDTAGRPLAERLFFAHFNENVKVDISTEKTSYAAREKVTLHMKLIDANGKPLKGLVSIACVQSNRIENSKRQDIEGYVYLTHTLSKLPQRPGREMNNLDYLENVLLVKGWRRYSWQDMMSATAGVTVNPSSNTAITGIVKYLGKRIKKPVELSFFSKLSFVNVLQTDSEGRFELSKEQLLTEDEQTISFSVNAKDQERYTIEIDDPYLGINKTIAASIPVTNSETTKTSQTTGDFKLGGLQHAVTLQDVIVKSKRNNSIYGAKPRGSNECGDFVTSFDYLNFPGYENEIGNHPPIRGKQYIDGHHFTRLSDGAIVAFSELEHEDYYTTILLIYTGCTTDIKAGFTKIDGVYSDVEFSGLAEESLNAPEPQWLSTLFWQAGIVSDDKGEILCSFYTGDITGGFRIVAQGVGVEDVFYGESIFNVK
jgi:hypothetical protein